MKISTVVFAQGWLDGQIEHMVSSTVAKQNEDPTAHLIASQVSEQWAIISNAVDELIKANAELERRMAIVKSAVL